MSSLGVLIGRGGGCVHSVFARVCHSLPVDERVCWNVVRKDPKVLRFLAHPVPRRTDSNGNGVVTDCDSVSVEKKGCVVRGV